MKHLFEKNNCVIIGNVWDPMSALIHEKQGFTVLGTTSWGIANTLGYVDGEKIKFPQLVGVIKNILKVITVPLSVDIESGYSSDHSIIVNNILTLADIGCSGVNIEDSLPGKGLKNKHEFSALVRAIKEKLLNEGYHDFCLNVRIDTYLNLEQPLNETIERATAYQAAGADGVFVPGLQNTGEIKTLLSHISVPLNLMSLPSLTNIAELAAIGVRRFSYGNAMSDAVIAYIEKLAADILSTSSTTSLYTHSEIKTEFHQ
ncbi:isocitrate lyase/phosphoenolpyruvate mutase family protein [Bisgaard Taxon 10/6]|uniref:isocitrate lyase/PEP mutase family protein n=1 Tax=Exercitatus varius TaxID=67857 RepID=UPI00294AF47A|nr:isocitrate lyase/phosphoenolpyruvate mutase family protein [Exercitatus varius]MDG2916225.1 isocitrate lyase/phosphoenolpyruvate mutase family protein [Exercitatus varius]MDG2952068.1 isocitrate lyase/phosphoenolpyruvate mutase family protein [Exercitatus varius]MDG2957399.1 isocitrate lyase/phosphoenolpyruvate mutase family protein [Exercitatus varius]